MRVGPFQSVFGLLLISGFCLSCGWIIVHPRDVSQGNLFIGNGLGVAVLMVLSPSRAQLIFPLSASITFLSASESSSFTFLQADLDVSFFRLEKILRR